MPSYNRLIIIIVAIFLFGGCATTQTKLQTIKQLQQNDLDILLALDYQYKKQYKKATKIYTKLYNSTKKDIYLKRAILLGYKSKQYNKVISLANIGIKTFPKDYQYYTQQKILAFIELKQLDKAKQLSQQLLTKYPTSLNYEIIANIFYNQKDFKNSAKYYESAYAKNQNLNTLLRLTDILYTYLQQKSKALAYLQTYLQQKGCHKKVCGKLFLWYQEQGDVDGMLSVLSKMYQKAKQLNISQDKVASIQALILALLEQKDIKFSIDFLEKTKIDQERLINLYYQNNQLKKALKLTRKLYKKTHDPQLLGKIAIYEFELAKDKKKVLKHIIANFELSLSSGINNPNFQNYYGYLLIDYDIDIKKGISLVKQALKTYPNNIAYIDSLSWGYYKLHKCKEALQTIKPILSLVGQQDIEIKLHYNKILKCLKNRKKFLK